MREKKGGVEVCLNILIKLSEFKVVCQYYDGLGAEGGDGEARVS